jgi:tetratricopeptide (TPR) repeat protein
MKHYINIKSFDLFIILISLFLFLYGCAVKKQLPVCYKNGVRYCTINGAFKGKWYDYYHLGLSCMQGGCYDEAIKCFNQASQRPLRNNDQRMVRTYGMHVIDYFPHRELGIIHYFMGNLEQSQKELKLSISQESSEKAKFYLDKVRKGLMIIQKQMVSIPQIALDLTTISNIWTNDYPVYISGKAIDKQYICKLSIANQSVFLANARQKVDFSFPLRLEPGRHKISIVAENLLKGKKKQTLVINIDRTGPLIMIDRIHDKKCISGLLYDASGEIQVFANGKPVKLSTGKKIIFRVPFEQSTPKIVLTASDRAGNKTQAVVYHSLFGQTHMPQMLLVSNDTQTVQDNCHPESLFKNLIHIDHWHDKNTVFLKNVHISGKIHSLINLKYLRINNYPIITDHECKDIKSRNDFYFMHSVQLNEGENKVCIQAELQSGKIISKEIHFIRKINQMLQLKFRFAMKLFPFDKMKKHNSVGQHFYNPFIIGMIQNNRFQIILSDDLQRDLTITTSEKLAKQTENKSKPKLLKLIMHDTGTGGIEIVGRIFDNQAIIMDFVDVYLEFENNIPLEKILMRLAQRMAKKFHTRFPLVSGVIKKIHENELIVVPQKWYYGKGTLKHKWPVYIYKPIHREPLESFDAVFIGQTFIRKIINNGFAINKVNHATINIGDQVITQ